MKVLFIAKFFVHDNFGRDPLGILYLSSTLKNAGHITSIADASNKKEMVQVFQEFDPDIVAFSVTTSTYQDYIPINLELKKLKANLYSIFGGPHCTFYPEFIENFEHIDAICIGEGEEAIVDLVTRMESGEEYENTPNFHVRKNGAIVRNAVRPLISDINSIAFPDRELLKAYPEIYDFPVKTFMTTRGCPFDCTYCFNYAYGELYRSKGPRVRFRTVQNVLDEIKDTSAKSRIDFINFEDDIFGMNYSWLEEFAEKYPNQVGIPYCCNIRTEYINEKIAKLLKRSGCHTCVMGIESGDYEIRKHLLNRDLTDEKIITSCRQIVSEGMVLETENILGLPGVSYEQEMKTVLLNIKCKPHYPASYIFQPQPKTVLGDKAIELNLFDGNYSKMSNYYRDSVLANKDKRRLERLRSLFFFIVRFPFLFRFTDTLVKIPLTNAYYALHAIARGYMARFRIMPYKINIKEFIFHLYRYLLCH